MLNIIAYKIKTLKRDILTLANKDNPELYQVIDSKLRCLEKHIIWAQRFKKTYPHEVHKLLNFVN